MPHVSLEPALTPRNAVRIVKGSTKTECNGVRNQIKLQKSRQDIKLVLQKPMRFERSRAVAGVELVIERT